MANEGNTLRDNLKKIGEELTKLRAENKALKESPSGQFVIKDLAKVGKISDSLEETNTGIKQVDASVNSQIPFLRKIAEAIASIKFEIPKEVTVKNPQKEVRVTNLTDIKFPKFPEPVKPEKISTKKIEDLLAQVNTGLTPKKEPYYAVRVDTFNPAEMFVGCALPGADEAQAVWQVRRITKDAQKTIVEWANGNDTFTNAWTKRDTFSYK